MPKTKSTLPITPRVRVTKLGHVLNWSPDLPDNRDLIYKTAAPKSVPERIDLRPQCPPIVNQYTLSSCTGNALAGLYGFLQMQELKVPGKQAHEFDMTKFVPPARLFIYFNGRIFEGTQTRDAGCFIRDGIKGMNQIGVCSEALLPYVLANVNTAPNPSCYMQAASYKIGSYMRIITLNDMLQCLIDGFPFVVGITIYSSFESIAANVTGQIPMPTSKDSMLGGHSVMCVGFDSNKKQFIMRNSWGITWGDKGYFYLPYNYLDNTQSTLAADAWTIRK